MPNKFAIIQASINHKTTRSECCILGALTGTIWVVQVFRTEMELFLGPGNTEALKE